MIKYIFFFLFRYELVNSHHLEIQTKCDVIIQYSIPKYQLIIGLEHNNKQDYLSNLGIQISNALGSETTLFKKIEKDIYSLTLPVGFSLFIPIEIFKTQPLLGKIINNLFVQDDDNSELTYLIELLSFNECQSYVSKKDVNIYFENNDDNEKSVLNGSVDCTSLQTTKLESDNYFYKITNVKDFEQIGITLKVEYNNNVPKKIEFTNCIESLPTIPIDVIKSKKQKSKTKTVDFMYSFFCKTRPYFYTIKNILHPLQSHISYTNFEKNEHFIQNLCLFTTNNFIQTGFFKEWCLNWGDVYLKPGDKMTIQAALKRKSNLFNYIDFFIDVEERFAFLFQNPDIPVVIQNKRIQIPLHSLDSYNDDLFYREIYFYNYNANHTNPLLAKPPFFIRINGVARENVFLSNGRAIKCLAILSENQENSTLEIEDSFDHMFNASNSLNFDLVDSNCNPIPFSNNSFIMLKISQL